MRTTEVKPSIPDTSTAGKTPPQQAISKTTASDSVTVTFSRVKRLPMGK